MSLRTTQFRFGPVRQETGERHLRNGDLLEAINVRQTDKAHVYAKRPGITRTPQSFSGGTLSGEPASVVPGRSGSTLMRDTGDQLWSRSSTSNTYQLSGSHPRPWPTSSVIAPGLINQLDDQIYTVPEPFSVVVGSNIWFFSLTTDPSFGFNAYDFVIVEAATGAVIGEKHTQDAFGIIHASAAYDGTYVWLFWVSNQADGDVKCHRITPSTPDAAPVATIYYSFGAPVANAQLQQVQARYFASAGQVFVVAAGGSFVAGPTYRRACVHSVLDPATGTAIAAGPRAAYPAIAYSGANGTHTLGGIYILDNQDGSGDNWWYTLAGVVDTNYTRDTVALMKVPNGDFASPTLYPLTYNVVATGSAHSCAGIASATEDKQWVFWTTWRHDISAFGGTGDTYTTSLYQLAAGVVTAASQSTLAAAWVASGFAKVGTRWYFLTGFDDAAWSAGNLAEDSTQQRCYHVREFVIGADVTQCTFAIQAQHKMGAAPAIWHRANGQLTVPSASPLVTCTPPAHAVGTTVMMASAVRAEVSGLVSLAQMRIDTAKVYGKECQAMERAFSPGNVPVCWNDQNPAHEIAPLTAPSFIQVTGGVGADFVIAAACYAMYDADGVVWRSAPFVLDATIGAGANLRIPVHQLRLPDTPEYKVEVYLGTTASAKLQAVLSLTVTGLGTYQYEYFTTPAAADMVNGEILYTTGNALSNTWPVACQTIAPWRRRLLAAQDADIWASKELETGFGPLFNEVQLSRWTEAPGEITAMAPINANNLAILGAQGSAVLTGAGPDGVGNGNFLVDPLSSKVGCAAGGIALQGPHGCYFQDRETGRIMVATEALQVVEAAGGAYDYATATITAAAWYASERMMVFAAKATKTWIVVDYQHPTEVAPFGQVYLWTFGGLEPCAATVDSSGLLMLDIAGAVYRPAEEKFDQAASGPVSYQMQVTTGQLQPNDLQGEFDVSALEVLLTLKGPITTALSQTSRLWQGMAAAPNGDIYACVSGGDIYVRTAGAGNFVALSQTLRSWAGMAAAPNGDVYACVFGGDIYLRTAGAGNFLPLSQTSRFWAGMAAAPNGDIYACVSSGDIYVRTAGAGNFVALSQTSRSWTGMAAAPNGDVYACVYAGDIYLRTGRTGVSITCYPGYASRTQADARVTTKSIVLTPTRSDEAANVMTRPSYAARIQGFAVRLTEAAGVEGGSFDFEGIALEWTSAKHLLHPGQGRVI